MLQTLVVPASLTVWNVGQALPVSQQKHLSRNNSLDWVPLPVWNPQGSACMHSGPSLTQFLRESTLRLKMTWLTYKQELRWNCKPSNLMRTLCFSVPFSRSAHAAPGYITRERDVINMNISAGRQTPVCIPALVDYPRVASVTRGSYWDLNSECIKVLSTTVFSELMVFLLCCL